MKYAISLVLYKRCIESYCNGNQDEILRGAMIHMCTFVSAEDFVPVQTLHVRNLQSYLGLSDSAAGGAARSRRGATKIAAHLNQSQSESQDPLPKDLLLADSKLELEVELNGGHIRQTPVRAVAIPADVPPKLACA